MAKQLTYAQQMEQVLEQLGNTRPRLLLHACCGPWFQRCAGKTLRPF